MLEKTYIVRAASGDETAEVTIPTSWKRYHKLKFGDKVKIIANGVAVIIPPSISAEKEEEVREFLERGN